MFKDIIREWDDYLHMVDRRAKALDEAEDDELLHTRSKKAHDDSHLLQHVARNFHARYVKGDLSPGESPPSRKEAEANRQRIAGQLSAHQKNHNDLAHAHMSSGNYSDATKHVKHSTKLAGLSRALSNPLK